MRATVPRGLVSVMPQAWVTTSPWRFSKPSIIAGGAAEPPTIIDACGRGPSVFLRLPRRPPRRDRMRIERGQDAQPDGRHARGERDSLSGHEVEQALRIELRAREAPSWPRPARTSAGSPHAFAWNIGTTGSTVSLSLRPSESARQTVMACKTLDRWLYTTPFGLPVVPDV